MGSSDTSTAHSRLDYSSYKSLQGLSLDLGGYLVSVYQVLSAYSAVEIRRRRWGCVFLKNALFVFSPKRLKASSCSFVSQLDSRSLELYASVLMPGGVEIGRSADGANLVFTKLEENRRSFSFLSFSSSPSLLFIVSCFAVHSRSKMASLTGTDPFRN